MTNRKGDVHSTMPVIDESWWESVLAEEGDHGGRQASRPAAGPSGRRGNRGQDPARKSPDWKQVKQLYEQDQIVSLQVTGCNRGGLLVEGDELGGFVPFSHLVGVAHEADTIDRNQLMETYVGRTLRLKVIECVPEDGRIVFSERAAQAEPGKRTALFHSLHTGEHVSGTVTNVTDFGVFVDLGGVEGLVHISELSWGRVIHPSQVVRVGQTIDVEVLELSPERCRVALSLKRLQPNPWLEIEAELKTGQAVPAVITSVLSYGAFARLDRGVEGLIHASEMPLMDGQTVKDILDEGQAVRVRILHVDAQHQRMGLSMKVGD
jgi:small subunit ribosomal protein S1